MEDHSIEILRKYEDRTAEKEIHKKINRDIFKKMMLEFDIDLSLIFEDDRVNIKHSQNLNRFLTHLKRTNIMEVTECLIFIEEEYAPFKKIKTVLNEENIEIVKREMAKRYRIKLPKNSLENFIYE